MSKKLFALAVTSVIVFAACTPAQPPVDPAAMKKEEGVMVGGALMVRSKNIVDNAVAADNVTTLVAAVKAGGLVATLSSPGPFTVFAPTNDAFAALPAGAVADLLKPENKDALVNVLTYHVVAGTFMASDLKDGMVLKSVQGQDLTVKVEAGKVWINGATVIIADVVSSNGVTHVVDTVLLPPAKDAMMKDEAGDAMMKKDEAGDAMMKN